MGTGGAILSACAGAVTDPVLAMNGDVWFDMDAAALVDAARHTGAAMAAIAVPDSNRFGVLDVGDNGIVRAFHEKRGGPQPRPGLINAGLYAFTRGALERFSVRACSFEHDIAPALAASGTLSAVRATGDFIDIGTPENYARAESVVGATQHNPPAMMAGEI